MTRKMEKGVRKEHRFDDLLALKATKTDLDLDTGALDGNPARKIRGLQTSCSGQRNARRGARSILDGERELDVRDGEALLVGRVGRQRGRRGEGERGGVFCCEKNPQAPHSKHWRYEFRRTTSFDYPDVPHLVTPRQHAVNARADLEQKLGLARRVRCLDDFFGRFRNVQRGEAQFDDGGGLFVTFAECFNGVKNACDDRKALGQLKNNTIKRTSGEIGATATGTHPPAPQPFISSGPPLRTTRDAKERSEVDVKTLELSILMASWPSTSPEFAISSGACGELGCMRRKGVSNTYECVASRTPHHQTLKPNLPSRPSPPSIPGAGSYRARPCR